MAKQTEKQRTKTLLSVALILMLLLSNTVISTALATQGYVATFVTDSHCSITTYPTSNYSGSSEENQTSAVAKNSETGEIDTSGAGQINFTVVTDSGYTVDTVTVNGNYKNLKDPSETGLENTYRITKISGDLTVNVTTKEYTDEAEEPDNVSIVFSDNEASVVPATGKVTVTDTNVTIKSEGIYTLSGSCQNGSITVAKNAGNVTLILDSLCLASQDTAPIAAKSETVVTVTVKTGTVNTLSDTDRAAVSPKSCINSSAELIFNGTGKLIVNGNNKNGIKADGNLTINDVDLTVNSVDNSIAADNILTILSGNIKAKSNGGDCLKADPDEITADTAGNIVINGGNIALEALAGDGAQALGCLTVNGGNFSVITGSGYTYKPSDDISTKGLKADGGVIINGGSFEVNSSDDAIHSNSNVTISGGKFTIYTADDAIHSDALLTLSEADINVIASYEALEGKDIVIESGKYILKSSDDGINAVGTKEQTEAKPEGLGRPGMPGGMQSGDALLTINGGYIFIEADGDGIDSNGSVLMNDGTLLVIGSKDGNNSALDYDVNFNMYGGTVVALGQSNMAQSVTGEKLGVLNIRLNSKINADTLVYVADEASNAVFAFKSDRAYDSIVIASDKIESGKKYTVYKGGAAQGESDNGFYVSNPLCSGGSAVTTVTANSGNKGISGIFGGNSILSNLRNRLLEFFRKILAFFNINI